MTVLDKIGAAGCAALLAAGVTGLVWPQTVHVLTQTIPEAVAQTVHRVTVGQAVPAAREVSVASLKALLIAAKGTGGSVASARGWRWTAPRSRNRGPIYWTTASPPSPPVACSICSSWSLIPCPPDARMPLNCRNGVNSASAHVFVCLGELRCGAAYVFYDGFRVRGPGTIDVYSDQPCGQVIGVEPGAGMPMSR